MGLNLMAFQLGLGDLACPLPTSLLAQVEEEGGAGEKSGVLSQVDFLPDHGGGKVGS